MKKFTIKIPSIFIFLIVFSFAVKAQMIVTPAKSVAEAQAIAESALLRNGITISNIVYKGQFDSNYIHWWHNEIIPFIGQMGYFKTDLDSTNLGLSKGIILGTGDVSRAGDSNYYNNPHRYNSDKDYYDYFCKCEWNVHGDAKCIKKFPDCQHSDEDLEAILSTSGITYDATSLEFDFVSTLNQLSFRYIFASDEYPDFVCSEYNDIFAILLTGPKPGGGNYIKTNIAYIPNTFEPVSINKVNGGVCGKYNPQQCPTCDLNNTRYYVDNRNGKSVVYNGFTKVFTAIADVIPKQKYHIKFALADVSDGVYDSALFLEDIYTGCNKFTIVTNSVYETCDACSDGKAWVNITGGKAPYSYKWNTIPVQTTDIAIGLPHGTYKVCVTDSTGCTVCETVTVNSGNCTAHFNLYKTNIPHVYTAVNNSIGLEPIKYLWNWGDGKFDTIPYPTHIYDTLGYYNICLSITDFSACTHKYCYPTLLKKSKNKDNTIVRVDVIPSGNYIQENKKDELISIYPNPANSLIVVSYSLIEKSNIIIKVYDLLGREVEALVTNERQQAGEHTIRYDVNNLRSGVYILNFQSNNFIATKKLVIQR